jgi:hypothetical protein
MPMNAGSTTAMPFRESAAGCALDYVEELS